LLGSSSAWSTGGPGKGMRARTTINCNGWRGHFELDLSNE